MNTLAQRVLTEKAFYNNNNYKKPFTKLFNDLIKFKPLVTITIKELTGFRVIPVSLGYLNHTFKLGLQGEIKYLNLTLDDDNNIYIYTKVSLNGDKLELVRETALDEHIKLSSGTGESILELVNTFREELAEKSSFTLNKTNDPYLLDKDRLVEYFEVYGY